jgi:hypothetical protein
MNTQIDRITPGSVTTARLGNSGDCSWAPCAPVLVIAIPQSYIGISFLIVSKRDTGDVWVHTAIYRSSREIENDEDENAVLVSTNALNVTNGQYKRYMSGQELELFENAMRFHKDKIEQLPRHKELFRL